MSDPPGRDSLRGRLLLLLAQAVSFLLPCNSVHGQERDQPSGHCKARASWSGRARSRAWTAPGKNQACVPSRSGHATEVPSAARRPLAHRRPPSSPRPLARALGPRAGAGLGPGRSGARRAAPHGEHKAALPAPPLGAVADARPQRPEGRCHVAARGTAPAALSSFLPHRQGANVEAVLSRLPPPVVTAPDGRRPPGTDARRIPPPHDGSALRGRTPPRAWAGPGAGPAGSAL